MKLSKQSPARKSLANLQYHKTIYSIETDTQERKFVIITDISQDKIEKIAQKQNIPASKKEDALLIETRKCQ